MCTAKDGNMVKVHYTGTLEDGTVFDSSKEREPLEFQIGAGSVIPGFDKGVTGLKIGESRSVTIAPEDGYGPRLDEGIIEVPKSQFPPDIDPKLGEHLEMHQPDGMVFHMEVIELKEESVVLDANHPLAGKTLVFDIELVEIVS